MQNAITDLHSAECGMPIAKKVLPFCIPHNTLFLMKWSGFFNQFSSFSLHFTQKSILVEMGTLLCKMATLLDIRQNAVLPI
jgi:hypothetical protein